jgi:NAD(P)-dependent dehydrogenase (short-subunit alcohol dehydrogenase family)
MEANGRFALITGGGSGIGRASALGLHAAGYTVAITGRRLEELEKTAAMADTGRRMIPIQADVSKPDSVNAIFASAKKEFGRLDVLFNNAGLNAPGIPIEDLSYESGHRLSTST